MELLVVIAVLAILAELVLPKLAKAQAVSKTSVCLGNMEMLIRAWSIYALDNNDRLVLSYHGGDHQGGASASSPARTSWATGWIDWTTSTDNTNTLFLANPRYARLANYLGGEARFFKCPADTFLSSAQRRRGLKERVRSVSANMGIGDGNAETGPWNTIYAHIRKSSDFSYPSPGESWVFIEEHPDSINDPAFFNPNPTAWIDQPATFHEGATSLAFADGHAEGHRWVASLAKPEARRVRLGAFVAPPVRTGDADTAWLNYHAPRVSEKHF